MADQKVQLPVDALDYGADILGSLHPDTWNAVKTSLAPNPFASVSAPASSPRIQSLNTPLTLNRYQAMNISPQQPPSQMATPMRGAMLGRIPPATDQSSIAPTDQHKSFLSKVGGVLGHIGEVVGNATLGSGNISLIPGTDQYKHRLEGESQHRQEFANQQSESLAKTDLEKAEAEKARRGGGESQQDVIKAYSNALATGDNDEAARLGPLAKKFIEDTEKQRNAGKPEIVTTEGGKLNTIGADNTLSPLMVAGEKLPPIQQESPIPGGTLPLPGFNEPPKQAIAQQKEAAEKTPTDVNQYTADYLAAHGLEDNPKNRLVAHQAFTKETKTDPGVIRVEALGDTRGTSVTLPSGETVPMNWNQINRQPPGTLTTPAYNPDVQAAVTAGRGAAPKNVGTQVQSYGTFVRHAGDLYSAVDSLKNTDAPLLNKSFNWLENNSGDPRVKVFLAKLNPVRKEFASFLVNNHALHEEDRDQANSVIDENSSPAQMLQVLPSLVHTGTIRLEETNEAYKRATGKDFPELVSPEAAKVFKQMRVEPPRTGGGENTGSKAPAGATHIGTSSVDGKKYYLDAQGNKLGPAS